MVKKYGELYLNARKALRGDDSGIYGHNEALGPLLPDNIVGRCGVLIRYVHHKLMRKAYDLLPCIRDPTLIDAVLVGAVGLAHAYFA